MEKKVITKIVQLHCNFIQKEPFNLIFHLQLSQFRFNEKQLNKYPTFYHEFLHHMYNVKRKILPKKKKLSQKLFNYTAIFSKIITIHEFQSKKGNLIDSTSSIITIHKFESKKSNLKFSTTNLHYTNDYKKKKLSRKLFNYITIFSKSCAFNYIITTHEFDSKKSNLKLSTTALVRYTKRMEKEKIITKIIRFNTTIFPQ